MKTSFLNMKLKTVLASVVAFTCLTLFNTPKSVATTNVQKINLKNGSPLYFSINASQPRQTVLLAFEGGLSQLPADLQGASMLFLRILDDGPQGQKSDEFKKQLYLANSSISYSDNSRSFDANLTAPEGELKNTLMKVAKTLQNPQWNNDLFQQAQVEIANQMQAEFDDMRFVINHFAYADAFKSHPDIRDGKVSPDKFKDLKMETVKAAFLKSFPFSHLTVYTSGPMKGEDVKVAIEAVFKKELESTYQKVNFEKINPGQFTPEGLQVTLLDKPQATDNQIIFIYPEALGATHQERVLGQVSNFLLGGSGSADLFRVLRTERGLTYGAYSKVDNNRQFWAASTFGGIKQTKGLLEGIPEVIEKFKKKKVSSKNLTEAKNTLISSFRQSLELPEDELDYVLFLNLYDVGLHFIDDYEKNLKMVSAKDVENFSKSKFNFKKGYLYIMGDKTHVLPITKELKYPQVRVVEMKDVP